MALWRWCEGGHIHGGTDELGVDAVDGRMMYMTYMGDSSFTWY